MHITKLYSYFLVAFVSVFFFACDGGSSSEANHESKVVVEEVKTTTPTDEPTIPNVKTPTNAFADSLIAAYLDVSAALSSDDSKKASDEVIKLLMALKKAPVSSLSKEQYNKFVPLSDLMAFHCKQLDNNSGDIKKQREHFSDISDALYKIVVAFGTTQKLYKEYCPMAKKSWFSSVKDIKNPYYGSEMLECGQIVENIN